MKSSGIELRFAGNSSWLGDAEYTMGEQGQIYDDLLEDVIANPRWYLDQLDYLAEFKVNWINYGSQRVTKPLHLLLAKRKQAKHL